MVALRTLMPGVMLSPGSAVAAFGIPAAGITSTYRDPAAQMGLFLTRYQKTPCQWAPGKTDRVTFQGVFWYRKPGVALPVAPPGTSAHELGEAIDAVVGSPAFEWLSTEGVKRGWYRPLPVADPVHWQLNKSSSVAAAVAASIIQGANDMAVVIIVRGTETAALVEPDLFFPITNRGHASHLAHIFNSTVKSGDTADGEPLVVEAETYSLMQGYTEQIIVQKHNLEVALTKADAAKAGTAPGLALDVSHLVELTADEIDKRAAARLAQVKDA